MREWETGIIEDPKVQARLLADERTGKPHPSVMTVLMAYAYGKPHDTTMSESMIPMSEIEDARQSLEIKLQRIRESLESQSDIPRLPIDDEMVASPIHKS